MRRFLFNAAVAVIAGVAGPHIHLHGHTIDGGQQVVTAVGMGVVAADAGIGLLRSRRSAATHR